MFVCGDSKRRAESKGDLEQEEPKVGYEGRSCEEKWQRSETKIAEEIKDGVRNRQGDRAKDENPRKDNLPHAA